MSRHAITPIVFCFLVYLLACMTDPHHNGAPESTGYGLIVQFQPETHWHYARIVHQSESGYVKTLEPVCGGLQFTVFAGEWADLKFRWNGTPIEDSYQCYEILNVVSGKKP